MSLGVWCNLQAASLTGSAAAPEHKNVASFMPIPKPFVPSWRFKRAVQTRAKSRHILVLAARTSRQQHFSTLYLGCHTCVPKNIFQCHMSKC
eukprot:1902304-Amphidinium_carterae.1